MKFILGLIIYNLGSVLSVKADSTLVTKLLKNKIEIGIINLNLLDGYGFKKNFSYKYKGYDLGYSYGYTHFFSKKYFIGISKLKYARTDYGNLRGQKDFSEFKIGDIVYINIAMYDLKFGRQYDKTISKHIIISVSPSVHLGYRNGGGLVFLGMYPSGFDFESHGITYKGFGFGFGNEISLICYNHISLSINLNYWYISEQFKFVDEQRNYVYYPPRNMISFQPKLGVLF